jgi:hypothetical protein
MPSRRRRARHPASTPPRVRREGRSDARPAPNRICARDTESQAGDAYGSHDDAGGRDGHVAAAVRGPGHARCEDRQQCVFVGILHRLEEPAQHRGVRCRIDVRRRGPFAAQRRFRTMDEMAAGIFALFQRVRYFTILIFERLAHEKRNPFGHREALQHGEKRDRKIRRYFGAVFRLGAVVQHRLRQPGPGVLPTLAQPLPEAVDAQARDDRAQRGLGRG